MATETAAAPPAMPVEDEERLQESSLNGSLARLQEMHVALRNLRDTIPRIISTLQQPLSSNPTPAATPGTTNGNTTATTGIQATSTPDDLYASFSTAALGAGNDIKSFTQLMNEPATREVLEKAKASKEEDGSGIEGWKVVEHDDWLEVKKEDVAANSIGNGIGIGVGINGANGLGLGVAAAAPVSGAVPASMGIKAEAVNGFGVDDMMGVEFLDDGTGAAGTGEGGKTEEDVQKMVEKFRERHAGFQCDVEEEGKRITIKLPPPGKLSFQIETTTATTTISSSTSSSDPYTVTCEGHNESYGSVKDAIATRPRPGDLDYLLEMLAAYTDLNTRKCDKCNRLVDRTGKLPVVRRGRRSGSNSKGTDGGVGEWDALHQSCV